MHSATYRAYLLRFWRDGPGQPWRVALENPYTGRRHGFAGLELLQAFLVAELDGPDSDCDRPEHASSPTNSGG